MTELRESTTRSQVATPAATALWLLFVVTCGLMITLDAFGGESAARPLRRFFAAEQQTDSWRPMTQAAQYVSVPHQRPVYEEMLESRKVKFQYPLSSLLFTRNLDLPWLNRLSWFAVIVVIVCLWPILRRAGTGTPLEFRRDDPAVGLATIGLALTFYPLTVSYALGQLQVWITALFALALLAWFRSREELAGVAVGIACLLKPTYGLFVVWALLRRRFHFLVPMLGVIVLGTILSIVVFGFADNLDYVRALRIMSRGGEVFAPNQSVNGFLNRLFDTGDSLRFNRYEFAPYHPAVYAGTLIGFVALVALALWAPHRRGAAVTADFSLFLLAITITSPIAWIHHYGVVLPLLAATAPAILASRPWGRATGPALAAAFLLIGQHITPLSTWTVLRGITQSYSLAGGLVVLVLLFGAVRRPVAAPRVPGDSGPAPAPPGRPAS
jgi:hypothetical protein